MGTEGQFFFARAMARYPDTAFSFCTFIRNPCARYLLTHFNCDVNEKAKAFLVFLQDGDCDGKEYNHYNVVVRRGHDLYLFEPAQNRDSSTLIELLKIHFPQQHIRTVDFHPQRDEKDKWCMAYVCMFAQVFFNDKTGKKSMKDIAKQAMSQETPQDWLARMMVELGGDLPDLPPGHPHDYEHHAPLENADVLHFFH